VRTNKELDGGNMVAFCDSGKEVVMPKPYHSTTVAQGIMNIADAAGIPLTPMQLVKLTYISHGFSLGLSGEPLIRDSVEAWKYGPVVPPLYKSVKRFGNGYIQGLIERPIWARGEELSNDDRQLLQDVFEKYGRLTGIQLSYLTHRTGTPWHRTYRPDGWSDNIPNDLIQAHYQEILRASPN
jgi:uncharacterized phage-associated protein